MNRKINIVIKNMDTESSLPIVKHIYQCSIKQLGRTVVKLERHPLYMITDTLKYTYNLDIDVTMEDNTQGSVVLNCLDQKNNSDERKVIKRTIVSLETLLHAKLEVSYIN